MPFSCVIKVDMKYIAFDSKTSDKALYWYLVAERKNAMSMSESFAKDIITDIKSYFTTAYIVGINYEQN